jgi:hypothetical protein
MQGEGRALPLLALEARRRTRSMATRLRGRRTLAVTAAAALARGKIHKTAITLKSDTMIRAVAPDARGRPRRVSRSSRNSPGSAARGCLPANLSRHLSQLEPGSVSISRVIQSELLLASQLPKWESPPPLPAPNPSRRSRPLRTSPCPRSTPRGPAPPPPPAGDPSVLVWPGTLASSCKMMQNGSRI